MTDSVRRADPVTAVDQAVQSARLDMVFGGLPMTLAVSVVLAGIVVAVMSGDITPSPLSYWFGSLLLVSGGRALLYRRYRRERDRGIASLPGWERRFQLGCFLAGSVWGSSALLIYPADFTLQGFLAFVLAGVSSGAMAELSVAPALARSFIVPCVTPLAVRFFVEGDSLHAAMGTMAVLYVGLITYAMRRGHAQLRQTVAAQLDVSATRRALTETAQRVDVMKSEFVSVVSHELRTPLTSLRGALGLLAHQGGVELSDGARQLVTLASRNAERLHTLIEELLDMEQIESGGMKLELVCQPVVPLVEQSMAGNCAYAITHAVNLTLAAAPARLAIAVDADRFLQVIGNLLSNAIKFSPHGSAVEVAVISRERHARIEVRDRGTGIAPAMQPRIFSKFCQGDSSDSRSQGGTGLGLALAKAIVEQMKGTIGFESRQGGGTTFYVEVPTCEMGAEHA